MVDVGNNSMILPEEYKRIEDRIRKAQSVKNLAEAFMQFSDATESAGLGIVTIMLMLRKLGVTSEGFKIYRVEDKGFTLSRLKVPLDTVTESQTSELAAKITDEIRTIPKFPDNILELEKLLSDPNIAFSEVAKVVMRDPAITADLLKMVNSVQFMLPNKVGNINQAIALIGKKGLRDLLFSYGAQKIMGQKFKQMSEIWNHSFKCAFYAYNLARNQRLTGIIDDIYVAGILHDLGKIVISYFSPDLLKGVTAFCASKGISSNFIENWSIGISHAKIGSMIAQKWGLPEQIIAAIEFHHQPMLAPDKFRDTVCAIYLADYFISVEDGRKAWKNFEPEVLKVLKIQGNEGLKTMWQRLKLLYKEQEERFK
jgi:putative nucleotidyltransferase with HDIG domain